jgi:hypothetical protein
MTAPVESSARLWWATVAALAAAIVLLITVVLPAEYGIDPVSVGRLLGLNALNREAPEVTDELAAIIAGDIRDAAPGVQKGYDEPYREEEVAIELASLEEVEYKARMQEGDTLLYSWAVEQPLYVDMHGEPFNYPEGEAVRYEEKDGVTFGHGRVTATFPGHHGWYWLNTNEAPVTVRLKVSGYYERLEEVYRNQQ